MFAADYGIWRLWVASGLNQSWVHRSKNTSRRTSHLLAAAGSLFKHVKRTVERREEQASPGALRVDTGFS